MPCHIGRVQKATELINSHRVSCDLYTSLLSSLHRVVLSARDHGTLPYVCYYLILTSRPLKNTLVYYQLFDSNGQMKVAKANSFVSAADDYTGRIDMKGVPPPKGITEIAKAIAEQEGCKDTFDSSEWSLSYQKTKTTDALDVTEPLPKLAGSKQTKPLMLKFDGDTIAEREEQGVGMPRFFLSAHIQC